MSKDINEIIPYENGISFKFDMNQHFHISKKKKKDSILNDICNWIVQYADDETTWVYR